VDARDERCAKNEALLREVNDRIEEVGEQLTVVPDGGQLDFRCECGRPDCEVLISLTISEYEHLRSDNDRFAVTPGHENDRIERVVERSERYLIVDKLPDVERNVGADGLPNSSA
jgi:hypothetical protein